MADVASGMTGEADTPPLVASTMHRVATLLVVVVPFLGLIAAIALWWGRGLGWTELSLLLGMYVATGLGITVGYHRLFVHRSFETIWPVRFALAVLGSMSVQGPVLRWAGNHRMHHQHSDEPCDPHSPHRFGSGFRSVMAGLWHAHVGWMFAPEPEELPGYVRDLQADRMVRTVSQLFGVWVLLGLLLPTLIGWLVTGTGMGALLGFIWGGLVRVFLVHHVTFSINSVCHLWGARPFQSRDHSRNNFIFGVLAFGEGWHNSHHAFPTSARHGLRWWELDVSYLIIRGLAMFGLAWKVRLPSSEAIEAKRLNAA